MTVRVRSFAKINLGLRIGPAREDGFHELLTVYQTIGLHDLIHVGVGRGDGIEIRCDDPRVPRDESNTCWRMVEEALRAFGIKQRVVVEIEKRLPVQGGLGGASANGVAALLGLERALKKSLPAEERLRIAAEVGSDLPLFLVGGTVLGVGRGEQVYAVEDLPAMACVVVTPEVGVSTPKAFQAWDEMRGPIPTSRAETRSAREMGHPADAREDRRAKLTGDGASDRMNELGRGLSAWLSEVGLAKLHSGAPSGTKGRGRAENPLLALVRAGIENDFERVVFPEYPKLGEGKRALLRAGAKYASLSGSGSTLYGLFGSRMAATLAAAKLRREGWTAQATATLTRRQYWRRIFDC
jgi:4-diphosphocytidyl-2-C-methyl-D-erythritol kinase